MKLLLSLPLALLATFQPRPGWYLPTRPGRGALPAPPADSVAYRQRAVAFIRQVKQPALSSPKYLLEALPASLHEGDCLRAVAADHATFTLAELVAINAAANQRHAPWTPTEFPVVRLVNQDTLKKIFGDRRKGWIYFRQHAGPDLYAYSMPIFLRHNTYCLFYTASYCGELCAEGSLLLYKKEPSGWLPVKRYCSWVS